jgi:GntR family transcriptional repressor for pyruvate dehydrogenase complex
MADRSLSDAFGKLIASNPERIREAIEFRLVVEPEVAALAAARRTEEDLARMRKLVVLQEASGEEGFAGLDARFHMALARATKNEVIWEMAAMLQDLLSESRAAHLLGRERRLASLNAHRRILEALENADPESCRQAMRDHLLCVGELAGEAPGQ